MVDLATGLIYYAVFLFSTTLHEAAHAWAAMRGGDLTAYHGGQVSLDPLPHIRREPFGMVALPLLGVLIAGWPFGYASAPYDPKWALAHPRRAALMALAGPAANMLLVIASAITVADNGLAFTAVAERAGPFWSGRALGLQNTAQHIAASAVPPVAGLMIGWWGYGTAFALAGLAPLLAILLVPVREEQAVS